MSDHGEQTKLRYPQLHIQAKNYLLTGKIGGASVGGGL